METDSNCDLKDEHQRPDDVKVSETAELRSDDDQIMSDAPAAISAARFTPARIR